jgi:hypothetical protein
LVHDSIDFTDTIRRDIARLASEKRIDYTQEELDASVVFQQYLANGHLAQAEDFIKDLLKKRPDSILFNLSYAKYLKEQKRKPVEAIARLERVRKISGNEPHILRLLMLYNIATEPPNFDEAHVFARELENYSLNDPNMTMDTAEFYTEWATTLKLRIELDPIKEMLRQQKYKELSDHAIGLLKGLNRDSHRWHYLYAQCHFNKWDYDVAASSIVEAMVLLPKHSYLYDPYHRLQLEIDKKARHFKGESRR